MNRNRMTPRERALYDVQAHAFAAKEWQLFLDTHPCSREALRALSSQTNEAREAARRYEERFGLLTVGERPLSLDRESVAVGRGGAGRCGSMKRSWSIP